MRRATRTPVAKSERFIISIHALREEGDPGFHRTITQGVRFLSTPSVRRATLVYFSFLLSVPISIHALREEGDLPFKACKASIVQFLSTPSVRRATFFALHPMDSTNISIHALREEGDGYL